MLHWYTAPEPDLVGSPSLAGPIRAETAGTCTGLKGPAFHTAVVGCAVCRWPFNLAAGNKPAKVPIRYAGVVELTSSFGVWHGLLEQVQ